MVGFRGLCAVQALLASDNALPLAIIGCLAGAFVFGLIALVVVLSVKKKKAQKETEAQKTAIKKQPAEKLQRRPKAEEAPAPVKEQPAPTSAPEPVAAAPAPVAPVIVPVAAFDEEEEEKELAVKVVRRGNSFVNVRYDRSFAARLSQTTAQNKEYYTQIKNELLSYGAKPRVSWRHEGFHVGRKTVARLVMRGKTLFLYLALDAKAYDDSKYIVEDVSDIGKFRGVPCRYRIKNDRRCRYAKELIAALFEGAERTETPPIAFDDFIRYETTDALISKGLIKVVETITYDDAEAARPIEIKAAEVKDLMADEDAEEQVHELARVSDKTVQAIVNVDTLGEYFKNGERVTLEEVKYRVPCVSKKATYLKVLARGSLSRALQVEADAFSLDAVKMIVLAGGAVYRKRAK